MALSKRLLALYQMVEPGSIVADIGCDHGQLSIALAETGISTHVYACDLREGPLARAQEAVKQAGLMQQITCRLRSGLDDLPNDVDTIVIAGMGFDTIRSILEAHEEELVGKRHFIIQSNKHVEALRAWISDHHYTILKEDLVHEDHYYEIVMFSPAFHPAYTEDEIRFGVTLPQHPLQGEYLLHQIKKLDIILTQMPQTLPEYHELQVRYEQLQKQWKKHTKTTAKSSN